MLVVGGGLFHRGVNRPVEMLRRAIQGVEPKRLGPRADHIVPGALRDDDPVVRLHGVTNAVDPDFALARLDAEELVAVVVDLFADLLTGRNGHEDELQIVAGVENAAKVCVLFRQTFDIVDEALHESLLCGLAVSDVRRR